jgi:DMSO/TMAO reductase YedYZ molybdopterin-dependent catalytic subunit
MTDIQQTPASPTQFGVSFEAGAAQLLPVTEHPFNAETPLAALAEPITPTPLFYIRSNFAVPEIQMERWSLQIDGEIEQPQSLSWEALRALPERSVTVTLECAGNGRQLMTPRPSGTPWNLGAVSTATFTGVSLASVLDQVRPQTAAREVVFFGADGGKIDGVQVDRFARSLPLAVARDPDVLLAWAMNGEPLPPHHGFPLRLIVPGWYGMASVKWLVGIRLVPERFRGHFQTERYVYLQEQGTPEATPVTCMRVRSLIATPRDGAQVSSADMTIVGSAWSGDGRILSVEVSTDGGATWRDAQLGEPLSAYAATPWHLQWTLPGPGSYVLISRATDDAGNRQPLEQVWNAQGYGNNVVQRVTVQVASESGER